MKGGRDLDGRGGCGVGTVGTGQSLRLEGTEQHAVKSRAGDRSRSEIISRSFDSSGFSVCPPGTGEALVSGFRVLRPRDAVLGASVVLNRRK